MVKVSGGRGTARPRDRPPSRRSSRGGPHQARAAALGQPAPSAAVDLFAPRIAGTLCTAVGLRYRPGGWEWADTWLIRVEVPCVGTLPRRAGWSIVGLGVCRLLILDICRVVDGPGSGCVVDGPGSGCVVDGPGSGCVVDGPGSGCVVDGPRAARRVAPELACARGADAAEAERARPVGDPRTTVIAP